MPLNVIFYLFYLFFHVFVYLFTPKRKYFPGKFVTFCIVTNLCILKYFPRMYAVLYASNCVTFICNVTFFCNGRQPVRVSSCTYSRTEKVPASGR